jgi:LysM repeat protein
MLLTGYLVVGILLSLINGPAGDLDRASAHTLFSHTCQPDGSITFFYHEQPWHTISYQSIYAPLAMAIAAREHRVIIMEDELSLWALYHNELQIHRNDNPDGTKYIIPSDSCAPLPEPLYVVMLNGQALAVAEAQAGGRATALAYVAPDGSIVTFAYVEGPGKALAFAQTTRLPAASQITGRRTHVVQAGENLFRIALRYGIPLERMVALNGITNINLVYVGQVLFLE